MREQLVRKSGEIFSLWTTAGILLRQHTRKLAIRSASRFFGRFLPSSRGLEVPCAVCLPTHIIHNHEILYQYLSVYMLPCICGTYWHGYTPRFASFHRQCFHGNISSSFQHIRASGLADRPIPCLPLVTRQTHAYTFQDLDQRVKKSGSTSGTAQTNAKGGPQKKVLFLVLRRCFGNLSFFTRRSLWLIPLPPWY